MVKNIFVRSLPERLDGVSSHVVEVSIGISLAVISTICRYLVLPVTGTTAPFSFLALALIVSFILGGWRSAALTLAFGVLFHLIWVLAVVDIPTAAPHAGTIAIFLFSQSIIIALLNKYHNEAAKAARGAEVAYKEIEHRTKNNYQIILSMAHLQGQRSVPIVAEAFKLFTTRITALSMVTEALRGHELDTLTLGEHLCNMTAALEKSLAPPGIDIVCEVDDIPIHLKSATPISLVVNEIITNAIKHAFPEGHGHIHIHGRRRADEFVITMSDNGQGMDVRSPSKGLGKKLIDSFVRQLRARLEIESAPGQGTKYILTIPMTSMV